MSVKPYFCTYILFSSSLPAIPWSAPSLTPFFLQTFFCCLMFYMFSFYFFCLFFCSIYTEHVKLAEAQITNVVYIVFVWTCIGPHGVRGCIPNWISFIWPWRAQGGEEERHKLVHLKTRFNLENQLKCQSWEIKTIPLQWVLYPLEHRGKD